MGLRAQVGFALVLMSALAFGCGGKDGQQAAGAATGDGQPAAAGPSGAAPSVPASSTAGRSAGGSPAASAAAGNAARAGTSGSANAAVGAAAGSGGASAAAGAAGTPATAPSAGASGGSSMAAAGATAAAGSGAAGGALPKVTDTDGPGPFETSVDLRSGPRGQSGVFRPDELGQDGLLHPVFIWGCGGMAMPSSYMEELTQIASHGFVVVAEVSNIGDDGAPLLAALDWVLAENERSDSEFYHKLDTSRIGLGGHSIGSVNAFLAGPDPRWKSTLHVAGGSLDNVNDPSAPTTGKGGKALIHPTAYICSESDLFGNVEKTEKDYANTTVPVFFTIMAGTEHIGAVGEGLPVIIAWLRWQLGDEEERRADFLDAQGMFATGRYKTQIKNW
jgi:hypothetical protein